MKQFSDEGTEVTRCLWTYDGLGGYLVAVVGLLVSLGYFMFLSVTAQVANADTYYTINQDINALKMNSRENYTHRSIVE